MIPRLGVNRRIELMIGRPVATGLVIKETSTLRRKSFFAGKIHAAIFAVPRGIAVQFPICSRLTPVVSIRKSQVMSAPSSDVPTRI